jgi:hypothetical protein
MPLRMRQPSCGQPVHERPMMAQFTSSILIKSTQPRGPWKSIMIMRQPTIITALQIYQPSAKITARWRSPGVIIAMTAIGARFSRRSCDRDHHRTHREGGIHR